MLCRLLWHSVMRLEPCGDAAATSSDRIYYLLWELEMYGGVVLLGFPRLLKSDSSPLDRTLSAYHICGTAGSSAEHHLLLRWVFSNTNFLFEPIFTRSIS